jgi:hypothetical protein
MKELVGVFPGKLLVWLKRQFLLQIFLIFSSSLLLLLFFQKQSFCLGKEVG